MEITTRGLTFPVRLAGPTDGTPILLLHGFPQNHTQWTRLEPTLHAAGHRTIAPDQRGYATGNRPTDPAAYHIDELTADALALLDALDLPAAHLVGHDWGAAVAWHLAGHHPDRIRTLTAISVPHPTAMRTAITEDDDQRERSAYIGLFQQPGTAEQLLLADDAATLRALFTDATLTDTETNAYIHHLQTPGTLTAALNWYRALTLQPTTTPDCPVPTTFLWGTTDIAIGPAAALACADHVTADYRFTPLEGIGHWIPEQAPAATAHAILARTTNR